MTTPQGEVRPNWALPRPIPDHPPPEAVSRCCVRFLTITLLVLSVLGVLAGVMAYLVASGHLTTASTVLQNLGSIGLANSYLLIGGAGVAFLFSSLVLASQRRSR